MVYFGAHLRYSYPNTLSGTPPQSYQLLIGFGQIPKSALGTSGGTPQGDWGTRPPRPPCGYATGLG